MNRPWHTWAAFGLFLVIVLSAMGWTSLTVLRLEEQARRQAVREENVRLALWRMDSALTPLLAQETTLPYFAYGAFYPADRAYDEMFNNARKGENLVASPLLKDLAPHAILYFQFDPDGNLTSPEVPTKSKLKLAQSACTTPEHVTASAGHLLELQALVSRQTLLNELPADTQSGAQVFAMVNDSKDGDNNKETPNFNAAQQFENSAPQSKSSTERLKRESTYQANVQRLNFDNELTQQEPPQIPKAQTPRVRISAGVLKPLWAGNALVLARRLTVGDRMYVQGCWLNWTWMQTWLLDEVRDLLPDAQLVRAPDGGGDRAANMLAALPVRLVAGNTIPLDPPEFLSPVRLSLLTAWGCALLAFGAVAALLRGTVALSERRAAFVSSVTHELRTPLTTFRMYAEMLAGGMVPNPETQRAYLETLRTESERLSHLVENVLAYARLERGHNRERMQTVALGELIKTVQPRLLERAAHAGLALSIGVNANETTVTTDVAAVEQILFNLVDNACKYAANGARKEIDLSGETLAGTVRLAVRDYGPGIAPREARKLFQPFSKSASQAAHSAPGVGLGLALSRRLARDLKGDLSLDAHTAPGASFVLTLPEAPPAPTP